MPQTMTMPWCLLESMEHDGVTGMFSEASWSYIFDTLRDHAAVSDTAWEHVAWERFAYERLSQAFAPLAKGYSHIYNFDAVLSVVG